MKVHEQLTTQITIDGIVHKGSLVSETVSESDEQGKSNERLTISRLTITDGKGTLIITASDIPSIKLLLDRTLILIREIDL